MENRSNNNLDDHKKDRESVGYDKNVTRMSTDIRTSINKRYLLGINDEPKKHLPPILGYARGPVVSLEIACEPLLHIVPHLPPHIWTAKQNSKNPSDGLTQDESAAVRLYTMEWVGKEEDEDSNGSLYMHLNRTLRMTDRTALKPWFSYLKLFLTGLAKLKVNSKQIVWRGIPGDHSNDYLLGSEVVWWGFSSCTTSLNVLESPLYLGKVGAKTLFSIETFNGRALHGHSQFIAEDEIILLPGTFFEVKSRLSPSSDLHIIQLRQKRPPFDSIEPPFHGAQLLPPIPSDFSMDIEDNIVDISQSNECPWYKRKAWYIIICAIIIIIVAIVLGVVLGKQKNQTSDTTNTMSKTSITTVTTSTTTTTTTTTTTDIPCSTMCTSQQTCAYGTCVGTGYLSCTLTWSRIGYGDIVVATPNNNVIYYGNIGPSVSTDEGMLDVHDTYGTGPTNVFWSNSNSVPPTGVYYVCFSQKSFLPMVSPSNPITATVKVMRSTNTTLTFTRTFFSHYLDYFTCDSTSDSLLGSFNYP